MDCKRTHPAPETAVDNTQALRAISSIVPPPPKTSAASQRFIHLDFIRGLAALAVAGGHLRSIWFVDYESLPRPSLLNQPFYFFTGLGHQAVIIFFVLSGFFVAGSVFSAMERGRWSWKDYAFNRMSRLWVVLLPALLFTLLVDQAGMGLTHGNGYDGRYQEVIHSGPFVNQPADLRPVTFIGNLLFLQTVVTPVYGTNGPLWSLANEFWYYLLFPFLLLVFYPRTSLLRRVANGMTFVLIVLMLPAGISLGGLVWLLGFGAYLASVSNRAPWRWCRTLPFFMVATLGFALCLVLARMGRLPRSDEILGLAFACMVPFLTLPLRVPLLYRRMSLHLSDISYTLYLFHFPVLALLYFVWLPKARAAPGIATFTGYFISLLGLLVMSHGLWWLFEKRTSDVKAYLKNKFGKP